MREIMARMRSAASGVIDHDAVHVLGQEIAHGALDQVRFLENAGGRAAGS